jgi:hypothetical protein
MAADIALGTLRHAPGAAALREEIEAFARCLTSSLDAIADAVATHRAPPPLDVPQIDDGSHAELTAPQFHRVLRQAEIVHDAATRLAAA